MVQVQCRAKRWGSSLGVIIPKEVVDQEDIGEEDTLLVDIKKKRLAREFFGILPNWKESTQKIKDELRKGWD